MSAGVTRILSDLHYHERTGLRDLSSLHPLLAGVDHLVLNGDTVEARHESSPALLRDVHAFFSRSPVPVTFIAGNHDPQISPLLDLELAEGRVWMTHGDIFWADAAPWSRYAGLMARLIAEERQRRGLTEQHANLGELLSAHRAANIRSGAQHDPTRQSLLSRLHHLFRTLFPPTQALRMLQAWQQAPLRARTWSQKHRPSAKFIIFGHIHYPGIWIDPGSETVVVNTGSFERPWGGLCVDVSKTSLIVRRVIRSRAGYEAGPVQREFPLAK